MMNENPLTEYFLGNKNGRLIHKWMHYFDIYHRHFEPYRNSKPTIVEFGVFHGGSLQMWKHYFGEGARICGVDINPKCKCVEEDGIEVFIGDQSDRSFLRELAEELGEVQIIVDDGGHKAHQQIATFEEMYGTLSFPGIYLVEDLHTSYLEKYGGRLYKPGTFIEHSKWIIDSLNAHYVSDEEAKIISNKCASTESLFDSAYSMTYYDSVLVIEKRIKVSLSSIHMGKKSF